MSFSISPLTPFTKIDWNTFDNRPPINKSMPFCEEKDWYSDIKCCMDGYTIEHVRDMAYDSGDKNTPEVRFLDEYPCLNGIELDYFVDKIASNPSDISKKDQVSAFEYVSRAVSWVVKKVFS